ncbi:iron-sulfur cluster assembly scaffold protein [Sphingomonas sp.]|uniref:iron-sulfur cluster assembly scaffold protein n=1 Tax=Sphingomonas sp. TaxID=28214 RepID=UPI002D8043A7|nr:iron-sulfur cluster assembly scaffold protein [Sphingomonas sp.]HEU0045044.1 iron-sulfur cluster assembly scaffold protein [Sphingomonas sp.]
MSAPLYNTDILRLAAGIPHHARLAEPQGTAERRSPVCGSRVTVDVTLGPDDRVAEVGLLVRACALGQASASLLAAAILGRTPAELAATSDALSAWLAGEPERPDWPGIEVLMPARDYPARHASIRLAFEAAAEAAQTACATRGVERAHG